MKILLSLNFLKTAKHFVLSTQSQLTIPKEIPKRTTSIPVENQPLQKRRKCSTSITETTTTPLNTCKLEGINYHYSRKN